MSHQSAIAGLKLLMRRSIVETNPEDHAKHLLRDESDRSSIILHGALIEAMLLDRLRRLMPNLNSDEEKEIFEFEGPIGSFSNRIRMAHALGIIDRTTKRKIDMLRVMRNVAAHCHDRLTFKTPEISAGIASLFGQPDNAFYNWENDEIRGLYGVACNSLAYVLAHEETTLSWPNLWVKGQEVRAGRQRASPEK